MRRRNEERGRKTELRAGDFGDTGGVTVLDLQRSEEERAEEESRWFRLSWVCSFAADAKPEFAPIMRFVYGVGNGAISFEADAFSGSAPILVSRGVVAKVGMDVEPSAGAEGAIPSTLQVVATEVVSHEMPQATRSYSFPGTAAAGSTPFVKRPVGSLFVSVGSVNIGATRSLVLVESTDPAGANVVARSEVAAGAIVPMNGRSTYLRVDNNSGSVDDVSIIFQLNTV